MTPGIPDSIETERLLLRRWREEDLDPFRRMNADPVVMEHFPAPLTAEQSDVFVEKIARHFEEHGYGLWAVEVKGGAPFIGYVGLWTQSFEAPFTPCVEVGWRLAADHWGRGYATEGGRASIDLGFHHAALDEIVSMTAVENARSIRVMQRLGMTHDPADDFDHPRIEPGHRLRRHVLYRIRKPKG
ncbi:MAG TPA: GNAT family N-acetyltransferase [Fimbriimonadaceae bacterium]|nr:GNAT family N-acetyltransferase [Fimbriimonadaceae bacterium]